MQHILRCYDGVTDYFSIFSLAWRIEDGSNYKLGTQRYSSSRKLGMLKTSNPTNRGLAVLFLSTRGGAKRRNKAKSTFDGKPKTMDLFLFLAEYNEDSIPPALLAWFD